MLFFWTLLFAALGFASLGAAGLAAKMAGQLSRLSPAASPLGAYVRATIALELAAAFPLIGWFVVIPLATVTSLGATVFALLRWTPKLAPAAAAQPPVAANASPTA